MAVFEDFEQRNKDQAYAKTCAMLVGLLFRFFFLSKSADSENRSHPRTRNSSVLQYDLHARPDPLGTDAIKNLILYDLI